MKLYIVSGGVTKEKTTIKMSAERLQSTAIAIGCEPVDFEIGDDRPARLSELGTIFKEGDVVLPLISGLEGFLSAMDLPYIGSDPTAAGIAANKGLFNDCVIAWGLNKVKYLRLHSGMTVEPSLLGDFQYPLFVKPARLGGSNGITRVTAFAELAAAIVEARRHDPEVIIEEYAGAEEIEIGGICGEVLLLSEPAVVGIPLGLEWHTSAAKQKSTLDVTVLRGSQVAEECASIAKLVCAKLGCSSGVRLDLFRKGDRLYVGEINCVPGHNIASNFPKIFEHSGISREDQMRMLIKSAFWKHRQNRLNKSRF